MTIGRSIKYITDQIENCLSKITLHLSFKSLECRWRSLNSLLDNQDIQLLVFVSDSTTEYSSDLYDRLKHIIQYDYFQGFSNHPFSLLIYDSNFKMNSTQLIQLSQSAFLPIMTHDKSPPSNLIFSLETKHLVRPSYYFESKDSIHSYLWGHAGYQLIKQIFSIYSLLPSRYQTLSSAKQHKHLNIEVDNLIETLFFCRLVHAIQQILRHQIGNSQTQRCLITRLRNWLNQFTSQTSTNYPLQLSEINIYHRDPDKYDCLIRLKFHTHQYPYTASLTVDK